MERMKVIRHITPAEKRWARKQEREAIAEFRAMSAAERKRILEALRRMTAR